MKIMVVGLSVVRHIGCQGYSGGDEGLFVAGEHWSSGMSLLDSGSQTGHGGDKKGDLK